MRFVIFIEAGKKIMKNEQTFQIWRTQEKKRTSLKVEKKKREQEAMKTNSVGSTIESL